MFRIRFVYTSGEMMQIGDLVDIQGVGRGTVTRIILPFSNDASAYDCFGGGVLIQMAETARDILFTTGDNTLQLMAQR